MISTNSLHVCMLDATGYDMIIVMVDFNAKVGTDNEGTDNECRVDILGKMEQV